MEKLTSKTFKVCNLKTIGFRPVMENREWLERKIKLENSSMNFFLNNLIEKIRMGEIEYN